MHINHAPEPLLVRKSGPSVGAEGCPPWQQPAAAPSTPPAQQPAGPLELCGFAALAQHALASSLNAITSMRGSGDCRSAMLSGHHASAFSLLSGSHSSMQSSLDMDRMSSGATSSSSGNSSSSHLSYSAFSCSAGSSGAGGSFSGAAGSAAALGANLLLPSGVVAGGACHWVFLQHAGREVLEAYEFGPALGQGTFGVTSLVTCRRSAVLRACKSISKRRICSSQCVEDMKREVAVLHHLSGHPCVVELVGVYEDRRAVHLVMELCTGGELLDELTRRGRFDEADAAAVMCGVLHALAYCHTRGVIHRDIKLENFLLARPAGASCHHCGASQAQAGGGATGAVADAGCCGLCSTRLRPQRTPPQVKVSDFGVSAFFTPGQVFTEVVGTPYYMAPEVLRRCYGPEADVWSAGVVAYLLIAGQLPFYGATDRAVIQAVLHGQVDLASGPWAGVSDACRDFVGAMLTRDPSARPSAEQLLQHPWLAGAWGGIDADGLVAAPTAAAKAPLPSCRASPAGASVVQAAGC